MNKFRNIRQQKLFKILAPAVILLPILLLSILFIITQNIEKIADHFIENDFRKSEAGKIYDLSYDKINLKIFRGAIEIQGVRLIPKKEFFSSGDSLRLSTLLVVEIHIPQLLINGLDRNFSLSLNEINLREFQILNPDITFIDHLSGEEKKRLKKSGIRQNKTGHAFGPDKIVVGKFEFINGKFSWFDQQKQTELLSVGKIDVDAANLQFSLSDNITVELVKTIYAANIKLADLYYPLAKGFYDLRLGSFAFSTGNDAFILKNMRLIPKYDKTLFAKKMGTQTERMDLTIQSILIVNPDIEKMAQEKTLTMESLEILGAGLHTFRDKNFPMDLNHFPQLPQQALLNLKMPVNIPKIVITGSHILYEELLPEEIEPGQVTVSIDTASIINVTNQKAIIAQSGPMIWGLKGTLFDAAPVELQVEFPADLSDKGFVFLGSIGACKMEAFNMITKNAANLRINKGNLQKMDFNISANETYAAGELTMQYSDLSVVPLKNDKKHKKDELSILGNIADLVIKNSNPSSHRDMQAKPAEAFFERDKNKGIFNYMVKTLISGIKNTILPITAKSEEKYRRKSEQETKQTKRLQRRENRKEKNKINESGLRRCNKFTKCG
jgi:hypothetical protein